MKDPNYQRLQNEKRKETKAWCLEHRGEPCANCGSTVMVEFHHVVPLANGGNDVPGNLVPLCKDCHYKAHQKVWKNRTIYKKQGSPEKYVPDEVIQAYKDGKISAYGAGKLFGVSDSTIKRRAGFCGERLKSKSKHKRITKQIEEAFHNGEMTFQDVLERL